MLDFECWDFVLGILCLLYLDFVFLDFGFWDLGWILRFLDFGICGFGDFRMCMFLDFRCWDFVFWILYVYLFDFGILCS